MADDRQPDRAIADDKIKRYLLNVDHPEGGAKARFFLTCGFDLSAPDPFIEASLAHGQSRHLVSETSGRFGVKRVYEGPLATPHGANPLVRSVWHRGRATLASCW
jgi:hypothetical protein